MNKKIEKESYILFLSSVAVDFAKNGVHAEALTRELRPTQYPHFMEKRDKKLYQSRSILGQLYDELEEVKVDLNSEEHQNIDQFPYSDLLVDGDEAYVEDARIIRQEYNRDCEFIIDH
jgi:RNA-dependent RNA polymerase